LFIQSQNKVHNNFLNENAQEAVFNTAQRITDYKNQVNSFRMLACKELRNLIDKKRSIHGDDGENQKFLETVLEPSETAENEGMFDKKKEFSVLTGFSSNYL
jgi:hypothetical protein